MLLILIVNQIDMDDPTGGMWIYLIFLAFPLARILPRILRKYSLDEIPQIYSVIKGDMSLVGPRPALFNQYDLIELRKKKGVDKLKPGITGLAQINGRDEMSIPVKVGYDEEYLKRFSMRLDLYILWLTFLKVLRKEGVAH